MNRRSLLRTLAALPFMGWIAGTISDDHQGVIRHGTLTMKEVQEKYHLSPLMLAGFGRVNRIENGLVGLELIHLPNGLGGPAERVDNCIHWVQRPQGPIRIGAMVWLSHGKIVMAEC